jgi:hypothetical protein
MNKYDFKKLPSQEINNTNFEPKYLFKATYQIEKKTTVKQKTSTLKELKNVK